MAHVLTLDEEIIDTWTNSCSVVNRFIHSSSTHTRVLGKPQLTLGPKNRTKSDFFDEFQTKNWVNLGKWSEFGQKSEKSDPLGDTAVPKRKSARACADS